MIYRERQLTQLTDLGKEVLPMLERTLASAQAVRRRAQEFRRKEVAPLRIGLAPSISASLVLDPIAEIAKAVPGLHVELREGSAEKLVDFLLETGLAFTHINTGRSSAPLALREDYIASRCCLKC